MVSKHDFLKKIVWKKYDLFFYFRQYQHSMADIILFQFWLLGLHEHLITNTKAARRSPQVVSVWNFLMSSRVRAGLCYPLRSVIVHAHNARTSAGEWGEGSPRFPNLCWFVMFFLDVLLNFTYIWILNVATVTFLDLACV